MAIGLVVHFHEFEGQVLLEFVDDQASAAVTGIADNSQRAEGTGIDVTQQVVDIGAHHFQGLIAALLGRIGKGLQHPVTDVVQTVIGADGPGFGADHFHAVVVFGVVAGGDHDATVHLVVAGGEVHLLGATQANIKDIRPGCHQAGAQGFGNVRAGEADVVADDHFFRAGHFHVGPADFLGQDRVELIRHSSAQIVGFKAGQVHCLVLLRGG